MFFMTYLHWNSNRLQINGLIDHVKLSIYEMISKFCLLLLLVTKQISHQLDKNKYSNRTEKKKAVISYWVFWNSQYAILFHFSCASSTSFKMVKITYEKMLSFKNNVKMLIRVMLSILIVIYLLAHQFHL